MSFQTKILQKQVPKSWNEHTIHFLLREASFAVFSSRSFKTLHFQVKFRPASGKMASQLKIDDLRAELSKRGLSSSGIKPTLVKRLESAISKENSLKLADSNCDSINKKRQNDCTDGDSVGSEKVRAIDKLRSLNVKQLREEATRRGISTSGSKKELLDRLCDDSKAVSTDIIEDKEEDNPKENKKEKLVTATKKGSAVLDQWLPDHIKSEYHVLQRNDGIYDAMLNQTNIGDNNNKFYVLQVLESDDGGRFMVYNRWGRVGVKGQDKLYGPYTSAESAIQEFEQKFYAKTKNLWSDRAEFVFHPKCYAWLEMDYDKTEKETTVPESKHKVEITPRETQLEARIAKFISLICNVNMMKQQMMEIGYNAEKLPLGKLSRSTILKGYEVLKRVADVINQSDRKKLADLSGEFYTIIPHDFGFRKMSEFVIDTPQKLKSKLEMVEALGEIELATKLLEDDVGMQDDPLFAHYQRLHCELSPVEADSEEFNMIAKYMKNTHAKTHSNYTVDIVQIFRTSREGEVTRFEKFSNMKNRMLLWHGSRLTNWTGILSQGLRIAPPEAPVSGYMFGKGVYFADMFSKSANYCCSSQQSSAGVLLLCEVALGDMSELLNAKYDANKLPQGKLSTKGVGMTAPDPSEVQTLEDGVIVPLGKPKNQLSTKASLLYNEYIVYNVDQIKMRYLVHVNFNYNR